MQQTRANGSRRRLSGRISTESYVARNADFGRLIVLTVHSHCITLSRGRVKYVPSGVFFCILNYANSFVIRTYVLCFRKKNSTQG